LAAAALTGGVTLGLMIGWKTVMRVPAPAEPAESVVIGPAPELPDPTDASFLLPDTLVPPGTMPPVGFPDALRPLWDQAVSGNANAQHDLATHFALGQTAAQDFARAAWWYREAARQGVANAAYNLAGLYDRGLGVPEDPAAALTWYYEAARGNHTGAMYNIGVAFYYGRGVPEDMDKAADWFKMALDHGDARAAYNLGIMHRDGLVSHPDPDLARAYLSRAARAGDARARAALAGAPAARPSTVAASGGAAAPEMPDPARLPDTPAQVPAAPGTRGIVVPVPGASGGIEDGWLAYGPDAAARPAPIPSSLAAPTPSTPAAAAAPAPAAEAPRPQVSLSHQPAASNDLVRDIQFMLNLVGDHQVSVTGTMDNDTRNAISAWQMKNHQFPSGMPSQALFDEMQRSWSAAAPSPPPAGARPARAARPAARVPSEPPPELPPAPEAPEAAEDGDGDAEPTAP
jgi:TPR repeat protein